MIIRFDNLDDEYYSGQYVFDRDGFHHANYDYVTENEVVDLSNVITCDIENLDKICFAFLPTRPFVYFLKSFCDSYFWTSFTVNYDGVDVFFYHQFETVSPDDCVKNSSVTYSYGGNFNSWTSSKILYIREAFSSGFSFDRFYSYRNKDCFNYYPVIGFKNTLNYPRFRIYAKGFSEYPNFNCKYNLFLHLFKIEYREDETFEGCYFVHDKTLRIGAFCSIDNSLYFENFYGERVNLLGSDKPYFDLTNFFNTTNTDDGNNSIKGDFLYESVVDLPVYNINAFGMLFAFEIKEEVDFGTMSGLDCQCLTTAINSLNTTLESLLKNSSDDNIVDVLDDFHKSFTHAFNKTLITEQYSFGSGSVFKSNDLDNHDYYYLIDNKGKTCLSPIFIDKCDSDDLGSSAQKPLYISNSDTKGSSCDNPLYLNLCDMPAIKINDLFNRISVGGIDINSLPLDYTSLISTLLGSIITALGNLLKPSDTLTIALPNIEISNIPSIDINSMPNINISNTSSSPVNISLTNGISCNNPLNVNLCPFTFSEVPVRINSIPALDVDIDSMPTNRLVTHANNAVDISCICDELDDIDKGLVAEFASLGVSLTSIMTSINELAKKFVTSCDTSIASAFSEAFNLTNCVGSVFKANDDNWNGEDTLAGIWFKQLDYNFVNSNNIDTAFYFKDYYDNNYYYRSIPFLIRASFTRNNFSTVNSLFEFSKTVSFTDILKRAFFVGDNLSSASSYLSVFNFSNNSAWDNSKILNHACNVNPCSIKFCDNSLPVDVVNQSNNPVKVEMEPTSSISVNVDSVPFDPANIFINADGKTFLNNNNFK